jgi:hypothetical protein
MSPAIQHQTGCVRILDLKERELCDAEEERKRADLQEPQSSPA